MTPQLYYYPGNANLAVHVLLEEAGFEYELLLVDRAQNAQKNPEYLALNPNGTIPDARLGQPRAVRDGRHLSAADAYLYMLAWWARKLPRPPAHLPRVRACVGAVAARPATQRACASEGVEVYEPTLDAVPE